MARRNRWLTGAALAVTTAAALGVTGATQAGAVSPGQQVPPDATICTDQISADAGVVLSGSTTMNSGSGARWRVRVASAANGPETEVLTTPARTLAATSVVPPEPESWFFRGCVTNTGPLTATIQIHISPI